MSSTVAFLTLFLICVSSVTASTCFTDLKFTVSASKEDSSWIAKAMVDYNVSSGSNPNLVIEGTTYNANDFQVKQQLFAQDVSVDQCNENCYSEPFVKVTASAEKIPTSALPDYDYFPGVGYYKYHTKPTTWDIARKTCNDEGSHLAVLNSEEESSIFANYINTVPVSGIEVNNLAYIGFHDRFVHGEYLTIFDQPLNETGFYRWFSPDQPDNAGGDEFCGSVHSNGGLNDISCTLIQPFICEQELC